MNILFPVEGAAAVLLLAKLFFGYDFKPRKTAGIIAAALLFAVNAVCSVVISNPADAMLVSEIVIVAAAMIVPSLVFEHRKKTTFVWFGFILCSTFDYLESLIISFMPDAGETVQLAVYNCLYIAAIIIIIAVYGLLKPSVPPEFLENLPPALYIVLFFADYSAYYDVMVSRDSTYYVEFLNILKLVSAALIVGSFSYIIYKYASLSFKEKETQLRLESELRHYEEMMIRNRDIRAFRHDYKNNLFAINAFIKSGRLDEAESYISSLSDDLALTESSFSTGNYLADAILTEKSQSARQKGITVDFSGTIPADSINNSDICAVIANALDNALRGCEECSPCTVKITSEEKPSGVVMTFINPVKEKVIIKNNSVRTTKQDKLSHGIGLSNIKRAAKKYNGYVQLECDDEFFTLEVGMMYKS